MGKWTKRKVGHPKRSTPLDRQIAEDAGPKETTRLKQRNRQEEDDQFVDQKLSKKILDQARLQQESIEEEHGSRSKKTPPSRPVSLSVLGEQDESQSEEEQTDGEEDNYYENIVIDEEDERALEMFMSSNPPERQTLADIIKEKLTEKETEILTQFSDAGSFKVVDLDSRVEEMYKGVRKILSQYRSGKLPKAFKIIPSLENWEQVLYLTGPDNWTAAAMYQATRIFASNLKDKMAQRYYNLVLLPRVRDDIAEYKKLNFHLYQALRKALFKTSAFFKGIILPLCESGTCTLREAIIISSILAKNSIPVLHSGAAMIKISEMEYTGANSIFLRVLLDKKYSLPYRVVDAVVHHFLRFSIDKRILPVLWHQCLLTFAQRYKEDMSAEQKEALLDLLRAHSHPKITPEIRRELQNSGCRDAPKISPIDMEVQP